MTLALAAAEALRRGEALVDALDDGEPDTDSVGCGLRDAWPEVEATAEVEPHAEAEGVALADAEAVAESDATALAEDLALSVG